MDSATSEKQEYERLLTAATAQLDQRRELRKSPEHKAAMDELWTDLLGLPARPVGSGQVVD